MVRSERTIEGVKIIGSSCLLESILKLLFVSRIFTLEDERQGKVIVMLGLG